MKELFFGNRVATMDLLTDWKPRVTGNIFIRKQNFQRHGSLIFNKYFSLVLLGCQSFS